MSNPKAQAKYHVRRNEIETKLQNIQRMVNAHRLNAGDKLNWGHVGDLALVSEQLDEVAAFLGK